MIQIQNTGSYLYPDPNGIIHKIVHRGLIQAQWKPVIEATLAFYQSQLKEDLLSVYIRGSVAKGAAVANISDLDSLFISRTTTEISNEAKDGFRRQMELNFPFVNGVEIAGCTLKRFDELRHAKPRSVWHELIKTQSICVFGKDFTDQIPPFHLAEMFAHCYGIEKEVGHTLEKIQAADFPITEMQGQCTWMMKRLIRTGFEIVMLREQKWTRDLYLCCESFSQHYPEKSGLMHRALQLALNPTQDQTELSAIIFEFTPWLFEEISRFGPKTIY